MERLRRLSSRVSLRSDSHPRRPAPIEPIPPLPDLPIPHSRRVERPSSFNPFAPSLRPGDRLPDRSKRQKMTATELRELRELIQTRYQLDIEIWRDRGVKEFRRDIVIEKMHAADVALLKIKHMIKKWDKREYFGPDEDWEIFQDIKARINERGKRDWIGNQPWDEPQAT